MSSHKRSSADHVDIHRRLLFLTMLIISLVFAIKAGDYFTSANVNRYLTFAGKGLAAISIVLMIATVYWKLRFIPGKERYYLLTSPDSYVMQSMNRACRISWSTTFILLCAITMTTSKNSSTFPAEFYLNLTMFFMLAIFSISFFILFHGGEQATNS